MSAATPQLDVSTSWQTEMPLLTSRFFLFDFAKVIFLSGGIFYLILLGILAFSSGMENIGQMTAVVAFMIGGLGLLFVLIALVFFGNRWPMAFVVSPTGVGWKSLSRRGKRANRVATVVGVLAGNPGMAGAGLLATSQEEGLLPWQDVKHVKAYPALRTINIKNSWRTVVRLYCTPDNFSGVLAGVERYSGLHGETANQDELPLSGRPPIAVFEVFRRVVLAVCVCVAGWLALLSPTVLVKAERADFAAEYKSEFTPPETEPLGIVEKGKALIAQLRAPMTLDEYIAETIDHRLIANHDERWAGFLAGLPQEGKWMSLDDPMLGGIRGEMGAVYAQTQWSVMYLPVTVAGSKQYIAFRYDTRPRTSKAPESLIYPQRGAAWLWLLCGIVIYGLLPWAKFSAWMVTYDRVCVVVLDFIGTLVVGFFFALPLFASHSTEEALGGDFGMTLFLWLISACGALILIWAARCASFAVMVEQGQLRVGGLAGIRVCPYAEITSAEALEHKGAWIGVRIARRNGGGFKFIFGPLCRFEKLLEGLKSARISLQRT